jgi:hypothetical protein
VNFVFIGISHAGTDLGDLRLSKMKAPADHAHGGVITAIVLAIGGRDLDLGRPDRLLPSSGVQCAPPGRRRITAYCGVDGYLLPPIPTSPPGTAACARGSTVRSPGDWVGTDVNTRARTRDQHPVVLVIPIAFPSIRPPTSS